MRRFFTNKDVNRIYAHGVLFNFAERTGWIFGPLFLVKSGYSIPEVLLMWASMFMIRLPARYIYLQFLSFFGLVRALCIGIFFFIAGLAILPMLPDAPDLLAPFLLCYSLGMMFYWTAYHTIFGMLGDKADRGKQVAMLGTLSLLALAFEPYISALIAHHIGFGALFIFSAFLMLLSALPLLKLKIKVPIPQKKHSKAQREACRWVVIFHIFCAIKEYGHPFLWRLAAFLMLGSIVKFGAAMTAGYLLLAGIQLFVGDWIDKGKGYLLLKLGTVIALLQVFIRALSITTPVGVAASEGMSVGQKMMAQIDANFYNQGKDTENYFHYIYWAEVAWDGSAMGMLLIMAALAYMGLPLTTIMMVLAPIGLLGVYWINLQVLRKKP